MSAVEKFPILLSEAEEESSAVPPCFSNEGINVRSKLQSLFALSKDPLCWKKMVNKGLKKENGEINPRDGLSKLTTKPVIVL